MFGLLDAPCQGCARTSHNAYRQFFCGLSNRLAGDYGPPARFLVNRDAAFLSLLTASRSAGEPQATPAACCNPLARKRPLFQSDAGARYAAAVTVAGLEQKLSDEREDEKGLRAGLAGCLQSIGRKRFSRARVTLVELGFPVAPIAESLAAQESAEAQFRRLPELDRVCGPTAHAFGHIAAHTSELSGAGDAAASHRLGRQLGRLTYLWDALTDRADDERRERFNPVSILAQKEGETSAMAEVGSQIQSSLDKIRGAVAELRFTRLRGLVEDIVLTYLPRKMAKLAPLPQVALAAPAGVTWPAVYAERPATTGSGSTESGWSRFLKGCCCCGGSVHGACCYGAAADEAGFCDRVSGGGCGSCEACDCCGDCGSCDCCGSGGSCDCCGGGDCGCSGCDCNC